MNKNGISKAVLGLMVVALLCGRALAAPDAWIGPAPSGSAYPAGETDRRFATLSRDIKSRATINKFASETFRKESMILDTDRDPLDVVLRRSEALLADIARLALEPGPCRRRAKCSSREPLRSHLPVVTSW